MRRSAAALALAVTTLLAALPANGDLRDRRTLVAHTVRRVGFALPPEEIERIVNAGIPAWLDEQLDPGAREPGIERSLEPKPRAYNAKAELDDDRVYDRRLLERQLATAYVVREKLTLHWLDHFAVGAAKVDDRPMVARYEEAVRKYALGNFRALLVAIAKQPAMLIWLDNDGNDGSDPLHRPPNENFARELLQLYTMGTDRDGVPNYSQADVRELARALTGYYVDCKEPKAGSDPNVRCTTRFDEGTHAAGSRTLFGRPVAVPNGPRAVDAVVDAILRHPATATFQAKELLQRLATEHPSPRYVADIARVWSDNAAAPDQIARVVRAIALHPEFREQYLDMPKEPVELVVGTLRALPAQLRAAVAEDTSRIPPGNDIVGSYLPAMGQLAYEPPSVFSFYRPGEKKTLLSDSRLMARKQFAAALVQGRGDDAAASLVLDTDALRERIGDDPRRSAAYLLAALVDGGSPVLQRAVAAALRGDDPDQTLRDAVWVILTSPEYQLG